MPITSAFETEARRLFEQACVRLQRELGDDRTTLDFSPACWILSELLEPCTRPEYPANRLKPLVRRRLVENLFIDQGGDAVIDPHYQPRLERLVDLVVDVIERMRSCGDVADAPHDEILSSPANA